MATGQSCLQLHGPEFGMLPSSILPSLSKTWRLTGAQARLHKEAAFASCGVTPAGLQSTAGPICGADAGSGQ